MPRRPPGHRSRLLEPSGAELVDWVVGLGRSQSSHLFRLNVEARTPFLGVA